MDELPKRVLYTFYPDRILRYEQVVELSGTMLPYVRNVINKEFVPDGYVEEIPVPMPGKKHDYFRLTSKGKAAAVQIHTERTWIGVRVAELLAEGLSTLDAAQQAASECVKTDKMTS